MIYDSWQSGRFGFMKSNSGTAVTQKYDNFKTNVDSDGDDPYDEEAVSGDLNARRSR